MHPIYTWEIKKQGVTTQVFGRNNPSFASSVDGEHATGLAGDGNLNTWWQPKPDDKNPFWILDTEKGLDIQTVKILFARNSIYQYKIEVSSDKENWTQVFDNSLNTQAETERLIKIPANTVGRFVRIRFLNAGKSPIPQLAEAEVTGFVID